MSCFRIRNSVLFYWPRLPQRLFPKWNWNSPKFILLIGVLVVICNPFFYLDFALFSSCFQHNIIIFLNARLSFSLASGWRQNINPNQMLPHFVSKSTKLSRTKWGTKFFYGSQYSKMLCQHPLSTMFPRSSYGSYAWNKSLVAMLFLIIRFFVKSSLQSSFINVWLNEEI